MQCAVSYRLKVFSDLMAKRFDRMKRRFKQSPFAAIALLCVLCAGSVSLAQDECPIWQPEQFGPMSEYLADSADELPTANAGYGAATHAWDRWAGSLSFPNMNRPLTLPAGAATDPMRLLPQSNQGSSPAAVSQAQYYAPLNRPPSNQVELTSGTASLVASSPKKTELVNPMVTPNKGVKPDRHDPPRPSGAKAAEFALAPDPSDSSKLVYFPDSSRPSAFIEDWTAPGLAPGLVIDPINAVVLGANGSLPSTVQLASQKIPAEQVSPPAEPVAKLDPVPMTIEAGGMPETEPFLDQRPGILKDWMAETKKVDGVDDRGIGYERVAYAPFALDIANPMNQWAFRLDNAYRWRAPDEAEYFFARSTSVGGLGPNTQSTASYQDFDFINEVGNSALSARTTIPIRMVDPDDMGSTAGLGDIDVQTRAVFLTGDRLKLTQFLEMHMPTGSVSKGLGTGHFAMEPGILANYRWTDATYLHAEMKYLFPIPLSPAVDGTVLTWGGGISHVMYDGDVFAVIPTAEFLCYSIFDASATDLDSGVPITEHIGTETIPTLHFGFRVVTDRLRDLGTVEAGVSLGINLGNEHWYQDLVRVPSSAYCTNRKRPNPTLAISC